MLINKIIGTRMIRTYCQFRKESRMYIYLYMIRFATKWGKIFVYIITQKSCFFIKNYNKEKLGAPH